MSQQPDPDLPTLEGYDLDAIDGKAAAELASPGTPKASEPPQGNGAEVGPSAGPSPDNQAGGVDAPASHLTSDHYDHRCGYLDCVAELWEIIRERRGQHGLTHLAVLMDAATELAYRRDHALTHATPCPPNAHDWQPTRSLPGRLRCARCHRSVTAPGGDGVTP